MLSYVVLADGAVIAEGAEERLDGGVHLDVFVVRHGYAEHLKVRKNTALFSNNHNLQSQRLKVINP